MGDGSFDSGPGPAAAPETLGDYSADAANCSWRSLAAASSGAASHAASTGVRAEAADATVLWLTFIATDSCCANCFC